MTISLKTVKIDVNTQRALEMTKGEHTYETNPLSPSHFLVQGDNNKTILEKWSKMYISCWANVSSFLKCRFRGLCQILLRCNTINANVKAEQMCVIDYSWQPEGWIRGLCNNRACDSRHMYKVWEGRGLDLLKWPGEKMSRGRVTSKTLQNQKEALSLTSKNSKKRLDLCKFTETHWNNLTSNFSEGGWHIGKTV